MRYLLPLLVLFLAPGLASAQVYKCVDKDGRVKYVQTRPKDGDCGGVHTPTAPAPASDGSDPLKKFGEQVDQSRADEAKAQQKASQNQAVQEQRCAQARARLAALERASKIFTVDEKGERTYQSTEQNDQMREEARASVATECS